MAEKVTSMRLNEEDLEIFKIFAKDNGLNQQQAFNSLIALAELEKAKDVLGDRAKSIDTFRDTINRALGMFVNALEENTTAEQTIREELSKELQTKDNTISNLYEQLQEAKDNNECLNDDLRTLQSEIDSSLEIHRNLNDNMKNFKSQLEIANRNNNNLQDQVAEYKQYKEQYKALEEQLEKVKGSNEKLELNKTLLETTIAKLKDKINNDSEMLEFYKTNNTDLKESIKALEQKYKQEVSNIKEEHTKALSERIKANAEQLQSKNDIEIAKKNLEIEKLKNEIELLKTKNHRTTSTSSKTK